jgi:hypothetical protein
MGKRHAVVRVWRAQSIDEAFRGAVARFGAVVTLRGTHGRSSWVGFD